MMTELLVETNRTRIDGEDMTAVIGLLGHLAGTVEPAQQRSEDEDPGWTLFVHWLSDEPLPQALLAGLPSAALSVRRHFTELGKEPPTGLSVLDRDERVLASVAL